MSTRLSRSIVAIAMAGIGLAVTGALAAVPGATFLRAPSFDPAGNSAPPPVMTTPVAVFGTDERRPLPAALRPLRHSIGLLSSRPERTLCTAFCVGRQTIATAAHCLFRTANERRPDIATFRFAVAPPAARKTSRVMGATANAANQSVIAGAARLSVTPPIDATGDWALLRLAKPVCSGNSLVVEPITPTRIHRLAARGRLLHVAFRGTLDDWSLSVSEKCSTRTHLADKADRQLKRDFTDTRSLLLHTCDAGPASSGSPLLALAPDRHIKVVAMNVGTYQQTRYLVSGDTVRRRFKPATVANTAISADAFADAILAFMRTEILRAPSDISRLQTALNRRGFKAGAVDGLYGAQTRSALVEFERSIGLPGYGLLTPQALSRLAGP